MTSSGERQRGGEEGQQGLVHEGASGGGPGASGPLVYGVGDQGPVALFLRGEPRGRGKCAGSSFWDVELRWLTELSGEGS